MDEPQPSRRQLLLSGGAVIAALSGCLGGDDSGPADESEPPSERLQRIPEGVNGVVDVDADTLLTDEQITETINDLASEANPDGEQITVETALNTVQQQAGLDPRDVTRVLGFGRVGEEPYAGGYIWSDWTDSELTDFFESAGASTREYGDRTLSELDGVTLVAFGDGEYALGTRSAVEDAVDVRRGDLSAVGGEVERAFTAAREGLIRAGFAVPADRLSGMTVAGTQVAEAVADGDYSVYQTGDGYGMEFTLRATDETAAETLTSQVETALTVVSRRLESLQQRPELQKQARTAVETTAVSRDGRTVTVRNANHGAELLAFGVVAATSFVLGLGSDPAQRAPQVSFAFDYDSEGRLTITHHSGDHVPATELSIRGEGLSDTGSWVELGGSTSGEVGDGPAVVAGDQLTVEAQPDCRALVVWESASDTQSAVLAEAEGPGA